MPTFRPFSIFVLAACSLAAGIPVLPLHFEENTGQFDARARYRAQGTGFRAYFTPTETVLGVGSKNTPVTLRMSGASTKPALSPSNALENTSSYFIGNDASKWRENVRHYSGVRYEKVYDGIDLVFYGNQNRLEYDFVVKPGADAKSILMTFDGADRIETTPLGDLAITARGETITLHRPIAYQGHSNVDAAYFVDGRHVSFVLGAYDHTQTLVIDPILQYSTFLGGSGTEAARAVTVDAQGNTWIAGTTTSADFPQAVPFGTPNFTQFQAFIAKLSISGGALVFAAYYGGNNTTIPTGMAFDPIKSIIHVVGLTSATNLPVLAAPQPSFGGVVDGFHLRIRSARQNMAGATYLGGPGSDAANQVAIGPGGSALVVGQAALGFPITAGASQGTFGGGTLDGFFVEYNSAGSLIHSTFIGGNAADLARGVAFDKDNTHVWIVGQTGSTNLATTNSIQSSLGGSGDGMIARINLVNRARTFFTYLGGPGNENLQTAVSAEPGKVLIGGQADPSFTPTSTILGNASNASGILFKIAPNAAGHQFSSFLRGTTSVMGIAVDAQLRPIVVGNAYSPFVNISSPMPVPPDSNNAYVSAIKPGLDGYSFAATLGGSASEIAHAVATDSSKNIYVVGTTPSANFPVQGAFQPTLHGTQDAFVLKIFDN